MSKLAFCSPHKIISDDTNVNKDENILALIWMRNMIWIISMIWMRNEPNIKMENGPENTCTFWVEETISSL